MSQPTALDVRAGVPLAPFCTLGVGGPARHYVRVREPDEVAAAAAWARERSLPLFVLGGGSNLVVSDDGFPGLVLHLDLRGVTAAADGHAATLSAAAGEEWDAVVLRSVALGWAGLECLSGIPGRVGATPIQNVGAYGQEVAETVAHVECLDLRTGGHVVLAGGDCGFAYRDSRFKRDDRGRFVILGVTFRLAPGAPPVIRYAELERALRDEAGAQPTLADVRRTVLELRRAKSMVIDPGDENRRSVGSFFVNPTVAPEDAERVRQLSAGPTPAFPAADGRVKLSAAWLIEQSGLARGYGDGPVGLSSRHTLALVNRGGATARQVVAFARHVRDRVDDAFGVRLQPEPVFLGLDFEA